MTRRSHRSREDDGEREIAEAVDWLEELLAPGPMFQGEVAQLALSDRIRSDVLAVAKKRLGVRSENWNTKNKHARHCVWFWRLPERKEYFLV